MLTSAVAVKFISAPEFIVKSVSFDSIFSLELSSKTIPLFLGMCTSVPAAKLIFAPLIVRSVPSPSIFSPSSPKVRPILAGILISIEADKATVENMFTIEGVFYLNNFYSQIKKKNLLKD